MNYRYLKLIPFVNTGAKFASKINKKGSLLNTTSFDGEISDQCFELRPNQRI